MNAFQDFYAYYTGDHTPLMEKSSITSTLPMVMVGTQVFECLLLILMQVNMGTFPSTLFSAITTSIHRLLVLLVFF